MTTRRRAAALWTLIGALTATGCTPPWYYLERRTVDGTFEGREHCRVSSTDDARLSFDGKASFLLMDPVGEGTGGGTLGVVCAGKAELHLFLTVRDSLSGVRDTTYVFHRRRSAGESARGIEQGTGYIRYDEPGTPNVYFYEIVDGTLRVVGHSGSNCRTSRPAGSCEILGDFRLRLRRSSSLNYGM